MCRSLSRLGYPKYIKDNPLVVPQFELALRRLTAMLEILSKNVFTEKMLSPEDRLYEMEKLKCQAEQPFKHWSDSSKTCAWNVCHCSSGTVVHPHQCPQHGLKNACTKCSSSNYLDSRSFVVGGKVIKVGPCKRKVCRCRNGRGRTGSDCHKHNEWSCVYHGCKRGYYTGSSSFCNKCETKHWLSRSECHKDQS